MKTAVAALGFALLLGLVPLSLLVRGAGDEARAAPTPRPAASAPAVPPTSKPAATSQPASSKDADPNKIVAVIDFASHVGRVRFAHRDHVTDYEASCADCHHRIKAGPIETPHNDYFVDSGIACKQCHERSPSSPAQQACKKCHYDYSKSKGCSDKTPSPRLAIHLACWKCHDRKAGVEASKGCLECHTGPKQAW